VITAPPQRTMSENLPGRGSLAHRVCELFTRNPDETYSTADLALKYDVSKLVVENQLKPFLRSGAFRLQGDEWSIGPIPIKVRSEEAPAAVASVAPARKRGPRVEPLDAKALTVEAFDQVPERTGTSKGYDVALDRLTKPGQMFRLDSKYRAGMCGAITERHRTTRQRFATRKLSNDQVGVYRMPDATAPLGKPATKKAPKR